MRGSNIFTVCLRRHLKLSARCSDHMPHTYFNCNAISRRNIHSNLENKKHTFLQRTLPGGYSFKYCIHRNSIHTSFICRATELAGNDHSITADVGIVDTTKANAQSVNTEFLSSHSTVDATLVAESTNNIIYADSVHAPPSSHSIDPIGAEVLSSSNTVDSGYLTAWNDLITTTAPNNVTAVSSNNLADTIITTDLEPVNDPVSTGSVVETLVDSAPTIDIFASDLAEQSLSDISGSSPIGILIEILNFSHSTLGLPWWASIIGVTVVLRTCVLPVMIKGQKIGIKMSAHKDEMVRLTTKMKEAKNFANPRKERQATFEYQTYMKKHELNPFEMGIVPAVQGPIFLSFFLGLKRMVNLPVQSMQTGGTLWFTDLTLVDPYYILPFLCSASMLLSLELGGDTGVTPSKNMKNGMRCMSVVIFGITCKFPAAMFMFWITTSIYSLFQALLIRNVKVRKYLDLPLQNVTRKDEILKGVVTQKIEPTEHKSVDLVWFGLWLHIEDVKDKTISGLKSMTSYDTAIKRATFENIEKNKKEKMRREFENVNQKTYAKNPLLTTSSSEPTDIDSVFKIARK